jgi:hypothetical protein
LQHSRLPRFCFGYNTAGTELFKHNLSQTGTGKPLCFVSCHKNQIPPAAAQGRYLTVSFFYNPAASVSFHGTTDFFSGGYAYTANSRPVFQNINHQRGMNDFFASCVNTAKIAVLF